MKKIVAGSTAVLLMLTASGSLIGCKSAPDEPSPSSGSTLESTSGIGSSETDEAVGFDIDDDENSDKTIADDENAASSEATDGTEGLEGDAERISSGDLGSSDHVDENDPSGSGNSYGLASGEGVDGDGMAAIKGGQASDGDSKVQESAPNDEENFPSTMERMKGSGKTASANDAGKDGNDTDSSKTAGKDGSGSDGGGSRQSAVAPNANDKSSEGTGRKGSSGSANSNGAAPSPNGADGKTGTGKSDDKAVAENTSGSNSSGSSGTNKKGNDTGITGKSSIDGSRNANPTPTKKDDKSSGKNGSGSGTAQSGSGKSGSGSGTGKGNEVAKADTGSKSGSGSGNSSATSQNGNNKNGSGNGKDGSASANSGSKNGSDSKASNTGKEIAKADGASGAASLSTKGSGDGNGGNGTGNANGSAAKDKQGLSDDGTVDYVEKFSKWFHPALSDVQRCGYFYTTPEICQFDMIQGDFRKVSGYKKAAYGFVFGYSQPDPRGYLSDFIRFEINVDGEYALYTWNGQNYVDLVEPNDKGTAYFYEHPAIYKGYNTLNTIKIEDTGSSYNVYVNGTLIQGNIPYLGSRATKGVMAFFSVAKEHQEDLPKTPVNVGMRITDVKRH